VQVPLRALTHPLGCGAIFTLVVGAWHAPTLYEWALRHKAVHAVEHVMFFLAALLYWWPLLSPSGVLPRRSYAVQMLYILGVLIAMTPLFAYITFTRDILYPTYEFAPRLVVQFSPADDQLLAGVMMKLVGVFGGLAALAVAFSGWYRENR
jgi:putative membrane protein